MRHDGEGNLKGENCEGDMDWVVRKGLPMRDMEGEARERRGWRRGEVERGVVSGRVGVKRKI